VVRRGVAGRTKCDQVLLGIIAGLAAEFLVVNLEVGHRAARLASPAVSAQYLYAALDTKTGRVHGKTAARQVEAENVGGLTFEVGIVAGHVALQTMGFEALLSRPDAPRPC
jgi:hypothetical protein